MCWYNTNHNQCDFMCYSTMPRNKFFTLAQAIAMIKNDDFVGEDIDMTILPPDQVDEITDEEDIDDDTMGEAAVVDVSGSVEVFFIKIRHATFQLPLRPALWSPVLQRTPVELVRQSPQGSESKTRTPLLRHSLHQTFQLPLCPALWSPVLRRTLVELVRQSPQGSEAETRPP